MATIEKRISRNNEVTFRAKVRLKGYPPQTATFSRLTDAKKWAASTESAIREGRHFKTAEAKKHTLSDLTERYIKTVLPNKPLSDNSRTRHLNWWRQELGDYLLSDVTPALIAEKRDLLLSQYTYRGGKRSPATVNRYLAALSHAYTIAVKEWGWVEDNPLRKVSKQTEPRGRVRFLSDSERTALLSACKNSNLSCLYPIVVIALSTGARKGEIVNLKWKDIDFSRCIITLYETKNGEIRILPIVGYANEVLTKYSKIRRLDSELVFPSRKPNKPQEIRKAWTRALKEAEIEDFRFHDLRHSAASYLAMNGASLAEIAEVLGHKTLQMVKRYSHLSEAHTASVVEKMNKKIFG